MKTLTICQPFAALICLPESHRHHKRIENRTWPTKYRGPLAIHAGKSREWLLEDDNGCDHGLPVADMPFGAIVATATLLDCVRMEDILAGRHDEAYPWARYHPHADGPWCWILGDVQPLPQPIPARGAQGLWDFDWPVVTP